MKHDHEIFTEKIYELTGELSMIQQLLKILELDESKTYNADVIDLYEKLNKRWDEVFDRRQVIRNKLKRL